MKVGTPRDLQRFIHHIKKIRSKIITSHQNESVTNETVNIIILRMMFLSLLSYYGIISRNKTNDLLIENYLELYHEQILNHNLMLWNEREFNIDQMKYEFDRQLFKNISEFVFGYYKESITTLLGLFYEALHAEDSRKRKGAFFTPPHLARIIFSNGFQQLFAKQNICEMETSEIFDKKILDNACGGGIFLISSIQGILDALESTNLVNQKGIDTSTLTSIISKMIHGVDLDPIAIAVTEAQLFLLLAIAYGSLEGWKWNNSNLRVCDTLTDSYLKLESYDLIIGNPPYMKLSTLDSEYQEKLRNQYEVRREYNLHALFLTKSLELLREGGVLGYLLHKNLFTLDTYRILRSKLLNNHTCMKLVDCGHFKGVAAETAFIILKKGKHRSSCLTLASYDSKTRNVAERLNIEQTEYSQLISQWNYRFPINLSRRGKTLLTYLRDLKSLGDYVNISRGIETGSNVDYISDSPNRGSTWHPLLRGRDISVYYGNHRTYLNYNRDLLSKPGRRDLLSLPKVILQQNASHPIAYYDEGNYLVLNSTTYLANASNELLKSICVFLNSKLVEWFFKTVITNNATLTVNILPNNLALIPVPDSFDPKFFAKLCDFLQALSFEKELKPNLCEKFNLWHEVIAEAVISEVYLPRIFEENKIKGILQSIDFSSQKENYLLSCAESILDNHVLEPIREIS